MRRLFLVALVALVALAGCGHVVDLTVQAPATFGAEPGGYARAEVVRVVDGDTVVVDVLEVADGPGAGRAGLGEHKVRLLGIDTPESVKPGNPVECFGKEAAAALDALLEGAEVRLVKDVEDRDGFDRLLRYVYIGDEMANARMVANGYAAAFTYSPNVRHADLFVQLEREARQHDRGLWSPDTCGGRG